MCWTSFSGQQQQRLQLIEGGGAGCRAGPVCQFLEPNLTTYVGQPACIADAYPPDAPRLVDGGVTLSGQLFRQTTCEITYGPLNCDFVFRGDNECAPLPHLDCLMNSG